MPGTRAMASALDGRGQLGGMCMCGLRCWWAGDGFGDRERDSRY